MDVLAHYNSLTRELEALKDRVRNFSYTTSWQTDGEWKESVLRSTLRRYLPANVEPLRGFVVTAEQSSSQQIDVLLYDNTKPVLFRDGDLVFITPDAVRGIIEVKTRIDKRSKLKEALAPLARNAELIRSSSGASRDLFVGLFCYETSFLGHMWQDILEEVRDIANGNPNRIVNNLCVGCDLFALYWQNDPDGGAQSSEPYNHWHAYELGELAAGFFINNLVQAVAATSVDTNKSLWFPPEKETQRRGSLGFGAGAHNLVGESDA